jgi:hypothetical protein
MLRFVFLVLIALGVVALVTRAPLARRALYVLLGLMVLYTVLKLTGVIDAIAPSRTGVF